MKLSDAQKASLEHSTALYEKSLSLALPYLQSRGITETTATHFRLGVVGEAVQGDESYSGRLCIPYIRRAGVTAQRFRSLGDGFPKYDSRAGVPTQLYNVEPFFGNGELVVITEGELDTVVLHQLGIPSVGVPGASGWKPHYRRLFEDFERIYIFADEGDAGKDFGRAIRSDFPYAIVVTMPDDDVNTTFLNPLYGADFLRSLVE